MAEDRTYLKLDGVDGEVTDAKFTKQIQIIGEVTWSVSNMGAGLGAGGASGASGGAKADFSDISFMKRVDRTTPVFMQACATGKHFENAVFSEVETAGDGTSNLRRETKLTDVMVRSFARSGDVDSVHFTFSKIEYKYIERDSKGKETPHSAAYDLAKAQKV
ncbi:type VI secretion system tube protein Hcp [Vineibacter terrae]|uniref:Type VI secretion system tube protein Hcp n=1 Tax=Vineibacter terrae TaxID=2586908 RepID=A0A5C8PQ57_9HYPH|nr:type VI secretion system tube protein Hcp [Vineibacter terrae]TXL77164.1 type VI secretion system tube protein Hcp [Vineibacter terrae]